jgi:hypothetical protein
MQELHGLRDHLLIRGGQLVSSGVLQDGLGWNLVQMICALRRNSSVANSATSSCIDGDGDRRTGP